MASCNLRYPAKASKWTGRAGQTPSNHQRRKTAIRDLPWMTWCHQRTDEHQWHHRQMVCLVWVVRRYRHKTCMSHSDHNCSLFFSFFLFFTYSPDSPPPPPKPFICVPLSFLLCRVKNFCCCVGLLEFSFLHKYWQSFISLLIQLKQFWDLDKTLLHCAHFISCWNTPHSANTRSGCALIKDFEIRTINGIFKCLF